MKNILIGIVTLSILLLMLGLYRQGGAYHGGSAGHVIKDLNSMELPKERGEEAKLASLQDRVGSSSTFKVSNYYKRNCSACHGVNGEGIIGPKLIGQDAEKIYRDLLEYKSGRRENPVMRGLLLKLLEKDLRTVADEIGGFAAKKAAN